jgi:hypothetical protein
MEYYVIERRLSAWAKSLMTVTNIKCVDNICQIPNNDNVKIIPITSNNMNELKNDHRALFWMNPDISHILNDKCMFSFFMMEYFPNSIPTVHYVKTNVVLYQNDNICLNETNKYIKKKSFGCSGIGISILTSLTDIDISDTDIIISDYINHTNFYVGHFFVLNGKILKQLYFKGSTNNDPEFILKVAITKIGHTIVHTLDCDDAIFGQIFNTLNYTGFACADFIIKSNNIILFEINPRTGGSLFYDQQTCKDFFEFVMNCTLLN